MTTEIPRPPQTPTQLDRLGDYLITTLIDESSKAIHYDVCDAVLNHGENLSCNCDAAREWRETCLAMMNAIMELRTGGTPLSVMRKLAQPYRRGSEYPR